MEGGRENGRELSLNARTTRRRPPAARARPAEPFVGREAVLAYLRKARWPLPRPPRAALHGTLPPLRTIAALNLPAPRPRKTPLSIRQVRSIVPPDLKFVVDDITRGGDDATRSSSGGGGGGGGSAVGISWHVECGDGVAFPFSRGCSFYTLDAQGAWRPASLGAASFSLAAGAFVSLPHRCSPACRPCLLKRAPGAAPPKLNRGQAASRRRGTWWSRR